MNYILIWTNHDYPDCGGGTFLERFKTEEELHNAVNAVSLNKPTKEFTIDLAGYLHHEFKYKAIEVVFKLEPVRI